MIAIAVLAAPMALVWMLLTSSLTFDSFIVGFLIGFAILYLMKTENTRIDVRRLPDQTLAFVVYMLTLIRDIWKSTIDVTRRVLDPDLPMNPGMITVPTQDASESDVTAAFSAHGITITPGELVVDFDGGHTMYVHCLDMDASAGSAHQAQTKRLALLRRIQGKGD
ncbi:MAG: Na+/H+ antiporter subunit E [Chloroflexota bacterium]|nr:Na+/H+ antiporter subunit E [Chloroflexota bacterium]